MKVKLFSRVQLFGTSWTVAYQVPPSMGFSRQEYWSGLPFPSPGDLPNPGSNPEFVFSLLLLNATFKAVPVLSRLPQFWCFTISAFEDRSIIQLMKPWALELAYLVSESQFHHELEPLLSISVSLVSRLQARNSKILWLLNMGTKL